MKSVLIEWENYEKKQPFRVEVMTTRNARKAALRFKERRRRRADVLPLRDIIK